MRQISRYILLWTITVSAIAIWQSNQATVSGEDCKIDIGAIGTVFLFSPDDKLFITNLDEKSLNIWNVATGKIIRTLHPDSEALLIDGDISPDGGRIVTASTGGNVVVWETTTGKPLKTFHIPTERTYKIKFSPKGNYILAFDLYNDKAFLWNASTGKKAHTITKGADPRDWYGFSPSEDYLLIQRWDDNGPNVDIWETSTGAKLKTFVPASTAAISPDNNLVLVNQVGGLILWSISTNTEIWTISLDSPAGDGEAYRPEFSQDGNYFLLKGTNFALLWSVKDRKQLRAIDGYAEFSQDGKHIIVVNAPLVRDSEHPAYMDVIQLEASSINISTGRNTRNFSLAFPPDASLLKWAFASRGQYLATLDGTGVLALWNGRNGKQLRIFTC